MEVVIRYIDKMGRISIPSKWRRDWEGKVLLIRTPKGDVIVRPLKKRIKLSGLFDSIEVDVEDFEDVHKVRRAIYG
ncbi:MAG: hypothetical protein J7L38_02635 [Thermoproteales archaeon]|nr:hypothetical protein [Thermoproteales archaeon]RLE65477.1 MAG: hypothetical protein DRJ47_05155 [Thermoprotei archaeon]